MDIFSYPLTKYVRTPHLEGSRLQGDDTTDGQVPLVSLEGTYAVLEEKLDGSNAANSFTDGGDLLLQCRGHYLTGGGKEAQFNLMKHWTACHEARLLELFEDRFICFGEWCYSRHSVFMDRLPHYFNEFDIFDRKTGDYLSTKRRHAMLKGSPILSVPVLYAGPMPTDPKLLWKLVNRSLAKSRNWKQSFAAAVAREGMPFDLAWLQTDKSDKSEGLYVKIEDDEKVLARYKLVRADFVQTILDSGSHHSTRPILPNGLAAGVDLYAPVPTVTWEDLGLRTIRSIEELRAVTVAELESGRGDDEEGAHVHRDRQR